VLLLLPLLHILLLLLPPPPFLICWHFSHVTGRPAAFKSLVLNK
jgi:hypothetical protein